MFRSHKDTMRIPVKTNKEITRKYCCDLCVYGHKHRIWESESDLEIHRRKAHKKEIVQLIGDSKNHMCNVCLRQQSNRETLISHIKTHHLLTPADSIKIKRDIFICDYCNNIFFNKELLIAHIKFLHSSIREKKRGKIVCPICSKIVSVKTTWFHFLYHGLYNSGICPICLESCEDNNEVLEHVSCHTGYYQCHLCPYNTKREGLFENHVQRHKKIMVFDDKFTVEKVFKYFVPQNKPASWTRKFLNLLKGIPLAPELQICVLCRSMCENDEEMLQHIYGDHSPDNATVVKRHLCTCGEEFFNNVLLKHHIFTLKGSHRVWDGTDSHELEVQVDVDQIKTETELKSIRKDLLSASNNQSENNYKLSTFNDTQSEHNDDNIMCIDEEDKSTIKVIDEDTNDANIKKILQQQIENNEISLSVSNDVVTVQRLVGNEQRNDLQGMVVSVCEKSAEIIEHLNANENSQETIVYEILEVPNDSSEEPSVIVGDTILFR